MSRDTVTWRYRKWPSITLLHAFWARGGVSYCGKLSTREGLWLPPVLDAPPNLASRSLCRRCAALVDAQQQALGATRAA